MMADQKVLGIIPARGGSKGLPRKNIQPLNGKPLIAWSIEAGKASRYVDTLMVSTDDEEIAGIARQWGAEVPFLRPAELATDTTPSFDVIRHAVEFYRRQERHFAYLVLLEPTSPLRETSDIDESLEKLSRHAEADAVVSICQAEAVHPRFLVALDEKGFLRPYEEGKNPVVRRQDLTPVYFFEGTIYAARTDAYLARQTFYTEKTLSHVVPRWKSPEVDDLYDLIMIEAVLKYRQSLEKTAKAGAQPTAMNTK